MTAFFIATLTVKDAEKLQEYARKAGETIAAFGGEILLRGQLDSVLAGSADHRTAAVARFPDMGSLKAWYGSEAYQALVPIRDQGADIVIAAYQAPA